MTNKQLQATEVKKKIILVGFNAPIKINKGNLSLWQEKEIQWGDTPIND